MKKTVDSVSESERRNGEKGKRENGIKKGIFPYLI